MPARATRAALLCASLLAATAPLAAQQGEHTHPPRDTSAAGAMGQPQMMNMMMACPMMSAMMRGPTMALRAREALHLSASQVSQIEAVQRQVGATHTRVMDSMRVIHPRLMALATAPQFDERAIREAFERMGRLHTDLAVAMLRAQHETAGILTPEQRDSLAAMARGAHGGMKGMPASGQRRAGPAACEMMIESGSPGRRGPGARGNAPDSLNNHRHGAATSAARP